MNNNMTGDSIKDFLKTEVEKGHPPIIVAWVEYPISTVWEEIFKDDTRNFVWKEENRIVDGKKWHMGIELNSGRNFIPIVMVSEKAFKFLKKYIYKII